jgi:drug/metabolite transporter (DMT)-like permease
MDAAVRRHDPRGLRAFSKTAMELHRTSGRARPGFALALATLLLWGVLPVALRRVLRELDAHTLTWFRFVVAASTLAIMLVGHGSVPRDVTAESLPPAALAAALVVVCGSLAVALARDRRPAAADEPAAAAARRA